MIPYFEFSTISIGPINIHTWGVFVSLGMIVSVLIAERRIRRTGLDMKIFYNIVESAILCALVGARIFHVLFYEPGFYIANPIEIFKVWNGGMSSFGGIIGATIAALIVVWRNKMDFWQYADAIVFGFPLGWAIGRIGCFVNHLHIGKSSNSILAVAFPPGPRLDMGLLESIFAFALAIVYFIFEKRLKGIFLPVTAVSYGITRFVLDFWRASDIIKPDIRYFGLTPAQFGSIILVAIGFWILKKFEPRFI